MLGKSHVGKSHIGKSHPSPQNIFRFKIVSVFHEKELNWTNNMCLAHLSKVQEYTQGNIQGVPHLREIYYRDFHLRGFLRPSQEIPLTRIFSVSPPLVRSN